MLPGVRVEQQSTSRTSVVLHGAPCAPRPAPAAPAAAVPLHAALGLEQLSPLIRSRKDHTQNPARASEGKTHASSAAGAKLGRGRMPEQE